MNLLDRYGYSLNVVAMLLWPLSLLFSLGVRLRRLFYRWGLLGSVALPVPVIVVGNISVGGTGKTPLVARLVELLRAAGYTPGVISRGYGGQSGQWPRVVTADSDPLQVGDEPVLLAQRCRCPVVVGPDRVAAARLLLDRHPCNVLLSDDGLQHYRLQRDIEIAVVDGFRRFGNASRVIDVAVRHQSFFQNERFGVDGAKNPRQVAARGRPPRCGSACRTTPNCNCVRKA